MAGTPSCCAAGLRWLWAWGLTLYHLSVATAVVGPEPAEARGLNHLSVAAAAARPARNAPLFFPGGALAVSRARDREGQDVGPELQKFWAEGGNSVRLLGGLVGSPLRVRATVRPDGGEAWPLRMALHATGRFGADDGPRALVLRPGGEVEKFLLHPSEGGYRQLLARLGATATSAGDP